MKKNTYIQMISGNILISVLICMIAVIVGSIVAFKSYQFFSYNINQNQQKSTIDPSEENNLSTQQQSVLQDQSFKNLSQDITAFDTQLTNLKKNIPATE